MRNNILYAIIFFIAMTGQSQNPEIKTDLPTVIPPSPTVAALMKFEEVPVSNYTGVPDISVPLYSQKLNTSPLVLNLSLNYHTGSTQVEGIASDIGLGWSLNGVGCISRTVKDLPDEYLINGSKYGIYRENTLANNNYYKALNVITSNNQDFETLRSFLFDSNAKGIYDLQHDLWQFNFMGHSGRFYIEKQANNSLQVKTLDHNNLKIINHYNPFDVNASPSTYYAPTGFTIYDDNGYKYEFEMPEYANVSIFSETVDYLNNTTSNPPDSYNYISTFHLTKISDPNGNDLLLVNYKNGGVEHSVSSTSTATWSELSVGEDLNLALQHFSESYGIGYITGLYKPANSLSVQTRIYAPKKIDYINIPRYGNIKFAYQTGRLDDNYFNNSNSEILKSISVETLNEIAIKRFELVHQYIEAPQTKLFLKGVNQVANGSSINLYEFEYKEPVGLIYQGTDAWGYLKGNQENLNSKEVDIDNVDAFSLEKMKLSTGGIVAIDYESNTYTHIGNEEILNFDENPYNWTLDYSYPTISDLNVQYSLFTINNSINKVSIKAPIVNGLNFWKLTLYKDDVEYQDFLYENQEVDINLNNIPVGVYTIKLTTTQYGTNPFENNYQYAFVVKKSYLVEENLYKNYLYGGGYRVKSITTFEQEVDIANPPIPPVSQKKYSYNFFNQTGKSSGSLNSPKPIFNYDCGKRRPELRVQHQMGGGVYTLVEQNFNYHETSSRDIINRNSTKGGEIGYKNVTVYEQNHGKTNYEYYSSIDFPDIEMSSGYCLQLSPISNDFKRGNLIKEEIFDTNNRILSSSENFYDFVETDIITGLSIFGTYGFSFETNPVYKLFNNYNHYISAKNNGHCIASGASYSYCGIDFPTHTFGENLDIGKNVVTERYGWAKLASKTTKNYFYPNGSTTPNIVETNETNQYNPLNKMISESWVSNSLGENKITKYFYHTGNSPLSQNRISEIERIETYRGTELLSTSQINYNNNWNGNVSFLPETIATSKGTNSLESRVRYTKYDEFGHPLELQQENGTFITYIWGYNKTQPIAKIENATNQRIIEALGITDINSLTEANMSAINNLRNSLLGSMTTTYTYLPLIGVETITDPKGDTIRYNYDSFGRLQAVFDNNNNKLSENQYHYRTQN